MLATHETVENACLTPRGLHSPGPGDFSPRVPFIYLVHIVDGSPTPYVLTTAVPGLYLNIYST